MRGCGDPRERGDGGVAFPGRKAAASGRSPKAEHECGEPRERADGDVGARVPDMGAVLSSERRCPGIVT